MSDRPTDPGKDFDHPFDDEEITLVFAQISIDAQATTNDGGRDEQARS